MSTFNSTDLIAVSRGGQTYKAEFGDINATIVTNTVSLLGSGMRNRLTNGGFRLSSVGATPQASSSAGPMKDIINRWVWHCDGTSPSRTITRIDNTPGTIIGGVEPSNFARLQLSSAGSGMTFNVFSQQIEGARTLAGSQATLSFYAKAASAMSITGAQLVQYFGTGGSPSSQVDGGYFGSFNVTTSWQLFTATTSISSLSGKTIGTNKDDHASLQFVLPTTPFTLDIAMAQLEPGPIATPFEARGIAVDMVQAERFYHEREVLLTGHAYATGAGQTILGSVFFPTTMRIPPSVAIQTGLTSGVSDITASNITTSGFRVSGNSSATGPAWASITYKASAEY